jgi:endo-1,4-beta-xylanase
MKKIFLLFIMAVISATLMHCASANRTQSENSPANTDRVDSTKGLKDYFAKSFTVGVAVAPRSVKGEEAALILKQFNSITPENAMKMGPIHPRENEYFWRDADSIVAFAKANGLRVRGHTLCWHSQTPRWMFTNEKGDTVTREVLLQRLKDHITTVVTRYKGSIYAWDVVNEAISDRGDEYLRKSPWLRIIGEDFIAKAFEYAHAADPNAVLFYNDYNEINPVKREKIFRLVKSLKDAGVPIHGVGLQAHWAINEPSAEELENTLKRFSELGLQVQITELDISVYNKEHNSRERKPEDTITVFTPEKEIKQIEMYKRIFTALEKYKKHLTSVTFWNVSDRSSWLDNFPVRGRKDYPLLFDRNFQPKKAYWEVVKLAR